MASKLVILSQLNRVRNDLTTQINNIRNAASISYSSWDSDTRNAYQDTINRLIDKLNTVNSSIDELRWYILDDPEDEDGGTW